MCVFGCEKSALTNVLVSKLAVKRHYIKFCDFAYDFKTCSTTSTLFPLQ